MTVTPRPKRCTSPPRAVPTQQCTFVPYGLCQLVGNTYAPYLARSAARAGLATLRPDPSAYAVRLPTARRQVEVRIHAASARGWDPPDPATYMRSISVTKSQSFPVSGGSSQPVAGVMRRCLSTPNGGRLADRQRVRYVQCLRRTMPQIHLQDEADGQLSLPATIPVPATRPPATNRAPKSTSSSPAKRSRATTTR